MFSMDEFMQRLDQFYEDGDLQQVETHLLSGIQATQSVNQQAELVILNELIGYYRVMSEHQKGARCADYALKLIQQTGMQKTANHGTTLLNAATGFRASGDYQKAETYYTYALEILENTLDQSDYRLASLHNNMALLFSQTGRLSQAQEHMLVALKIIQQLPQMDTELATTYTNLGNICFRLNQSDRGTRYMQDAVAIFERNQKHPNPHYPAALSGLGEAEFHKGEFEKAANYYEKALYWIEKIYGKNDDWQTTKENLKVVKSLLERKKILIAHKMNGLGIAKAYYEEVGKPMLEQKYPQYLNRIAVGLVGEGSECLGFDDEYSTDHDFGPGFCIWLTKEDYAEIGDRMQEDYEALAFEWKGFPVRNTTSEGRKRVGVQQIDRFYQNFTGYSEAPKIQTMQDVLNWSKIPPEMLRSAVNGDVFTDELGEFTKKRKEFEQYPEPVRLYRIAYALGKMAQAGQYNYERGQKRHDIGMMYNALAEFIQAASEVGYLLNNLYMPFYKWRIRGMEQFKCLPKLKVMLEELMQLSVGSPQIPSVIESICGYVLQELKEQKLTESDEIFLESQKEAVLHKMQQIFIHNNM